MSWIYIVVIGYTMNAMALTIDKFLLKKSIPEPAQYTFNIGFLIGIIALAISPFAIHQISPMNVVISLLSGLSFAFALYTMYTALKKGEATRIVPYIGSLNPVFIFILAYIILDEKLSQNQILAFLLIIIGGFIISWRFKNKWMKLKDKIICIYNLVTKKENQYQNLNIFAIATLSAFLFAISYTLTKYIYDQTTFINGFIWTRFGITIGAIFIMIVTMTINKKPKETEKKEKFNKKTAGIFLIGQALGGGSLLLINYAFSINSVTLVQALQGIQYAILFIIIILLSKKFPQILEEKLTRAIITQKVIAIAFIGVGLFLLTI